MNKKIVTALLGLGLGLGSFAGSAQAPIDNGSCEDQYLICILYTGGSASCDDILKNCPDN